MFASSTFSLSRSTLIHLTTLFLVVFYNFSFFERFLRIYPPSASHFLYLLSLALLLAALTEIILHLLCIGRLTRPLLMIIVLVSSFASYFMDSYRTIIDVSMIDNILQTNLHEAEHLFNVKLLIYFMLLGLLPAFYIYKIRVKSKTWSAEWLSSIKVVSVALLIIVSQVFLFGRFYSSFFREHKDIRVYANPVMYLYSGYRYVEQAFGSSDRQLAEVGQDARIPEADQERELVIVVVGETVRADRFSLNGYTRKTNPLLEKEQVYSLRHVESCGTSTAVSVPCMFSHLTADEFSIDDARYSENLLDILQHSGVNVLWRDNNSDSKGVALRVAYEDFTKKSVNPVCDEECRDVGMLHGLQEYIDKQKQGDIIIVLHQMGNHGPDYFRRYPESFQRFTPVCETNQLDKCTIEQINNTYDNAILYTDYFLAETIALLKKNTSRFETAMLYVGDHGESLGENGIYLHGMPKLLAPDEQRRVPAILWFGDSYSDFDKQALVTKLDVPYSHDHVFHTVLGLLEVRTEHYDQRMDIVRHYDDFEYHTARADQQQVEPLRF